MKKLIVLIIFLITLNVFAQGEANFWYFGENAGLNFNGGDPVVKNDGQLSTNEGCASFSDSDGDLLFYTDGTTVWNKNHSIMSNGTNLLGNSSSTQSAIIVPHPGDTNLFYIFTVGANEYDNAGTVTSATEGLHCYTVDISLNGGLGAVTGTDIDLSNGLNSSWTEKVTSVKGSECNTYWVISLVNNTFYAYKIDSTTGIITTPVTSTVSYTVDDPRGYLKVSPDGTKLASANYGPGILYLYNFDDSTGKVSNNGISLISNPDTDGYAYGVEFSPKSTKLYCATYNYKTGINNLYQFDLESSSIAASKYLIKTQSGYRGALQLAPNGKIYATVPYSYDNGTRYLDAINSPEELSAACDYELNAVDLGNGRAMQGLPPFIASLLLPVEITDGNTTENINQTTVKRCIGEDYTFSAENIEGTPTYEWTFEGSVVSTSATLTLTAINYINEGTYSLTAETIDDCGFTITYTGEVILEVYTPPTIIAPTNILQCDTDNDGFYTFDFNSLKDTEIFNSQSSTQFEVLYFTNQTDADNNTNAISMPYTNSAAYSTDTIIARIQNVDNSICYETGSFTVQVFESPNPPTTITNLSTCDSNITGTDTDGIEVFDLTAKETEILNGQDSADFTITYFTDALYTNQITSNTTSFQNTVSGTQSIYIQIVNNSNNTCTVNTSFNIEVFELPVINNSFSFYQCDEDGTPDGITDFNLNEANDYLTLGDTTLTTTYFLTLNNAENNTNEITASPFSNATQSTVYARIENSNYCYRVATVSLLVSSTSFPENYLKTVTVCDDDSIIDGLHLFNLSDNDAEIINLFPTGQNLSVSYYTNLTDAQLEENKIDTSTAYMSETAYSQLIYVRVESDDNGECFGLGPYLELIVQPRPEFELDDTAIYCENLDPITVETYNANDVYTYIWTDESGSVISTDFSAIISSAGLYTVVASSSAGCESFEHIIKVEASNVAVISQDDITIVDDSDNNTITISTTNIGIGDYEFSLDDATGTYQDEPFFENVDAGIHIIYIQDKNNCGISEIEVAVIGYPKFFTPNNDGYNDTWKILGVSENFYNNSTINIFDRYGKLIKQLNSTEEWDGLYNGKYLPSTDYWFSVELFDSLGNSVIRKGHFSLIRR